mgnify:CR=1 FL=1
MMEFLAANFNLPTIIVGAIVFGGVGWITWHSHKHGGCRGWRGGGAAAGAAGRAGGSPPARASPTGRCATPRRLSKTSCPAMPLRRGS